MYFSKNFAAIGAALLFTSANAGVVQQRSMTARQIVVNVGTLTSMSQTLQGPANSINLLSGPLLLIGQGPFPEIITGFTKIINTVNTDIQEMAGTKPFSIMSDEQSILVALTTFVTVHQQLLNIIIGKAGLLNDIPFVGPPVAQVLRSLEGVVDTIAFGLIDVCPDVLGQLTAQKNSLDVTIKLAINAYTPAL